MRGTFCDPETGEVFENAELRTQEDRERYKKYLEKKQEYEFKGMHINEKYKQYGTFTWFIYHSQQALCLGITPAQLTKLIYLSTYINYKNRLMINAETHMTRADMQDILKVSDRTFKSFWKAIVNSKILKVNSDDKCLYFNESLFKRGKFNLYEDESKIRLYRRGIRVLYEKAKPSEHKFLSYLFQAIPYINKDYNVISHNPCECDLDLISPMQFSEFCTLINYDYENARKLKTKMKNLTINDKYVFSFVDNGNGMFCYVNPSIYYAGNKWDKVEVLGKF